MSAQRKVINWNDKEQVSRYNREYRLQHLEEITKRQKEQRTIERDRINKRRRELHQKNGRRDKNSQRCKEYFTLHKNDVYDKKKKRISNNPDKYTLKWKARSMAYYEASKTDMKKKAIVASGRVNVAAKFRGAVDKVSTKEMLELLSSNKCAYSQCDITDRLQIDHIIPLKDKGRNVLENLCLLCLRHHKEKTAAEKAYWARKESLPEWVCQLKGVVFSNPQLSLL